MSLVSLMSLAMRLRRRLREEAYQMLHGDDERLQRQAVRDHTALRLHALTRIILAATATYGSLVSFKTAMNGANGSNFCQLPRPDFAELRLASRLRQMDQDRKSVV